MSFDSMDISASGLYAQRLKMDAVASNIANVNTTRGPDGSPQPYVRKQVAFSAIYDKALSGGSLPSRSHDLQYNSTTGQMSLKGNVSFDSPMVARGVEVSEISDDKDPYKMVYNPSHPDSDKDGFVKMPNINVVSEMVDMISASRCYEANISSIEAAKSMINAALKI